VASRLPPDPTTDPTTNAAGHGVALRSGGSNSSSSSSSSSDNSSSDNSSSSSSSSTGGEDGKGDPAGFEGAGCGMPVAAAAALTLLRRENAVLAERVDGLMKYHAHVHTRLAEVTKREAHVETKKRRQRKERRAQHKGPPRFRYWTPTSNYLK
jgi:hypothetical protein